MKIRILLLILFIGIGTLTGCVAKDKNNCEDETRTDVSKFTILGIGTGNKYIDGSISGYHSSFLSFKSKNENRIHLENNNNSGDVIFISLDHDKNIIKIRREKKFSINPDYKKIKKQLYDKYGEPDMDGEYKSNSMSAFADLAFCWGSCKHFKDSHGTSIHAANCGKSLVVRYKSDKYGNGEIISFELKDPLLQSKYYQWEDDLIKKEKERIKGKESDLNL